MRKPALVQFGPVAGEPDTQAGAVDDFVITESSASVKLVMVEASMFPGAAEFLVIHRTGFVAPGYDIFWENPPFEVPSQAYRD
jgi:hypothetical protein